MRRREQGVVLVLVTVFLLLLISSIATFQRRAVLDATIARNRDATAQAEALARGGVRIALALLLEDRLRDQARQLEVETRYDPWARAEALDLPLAEGADLRLRIRDAGARLNLNALFDEGTARDPAAVQGLLAELLERAIQEADIRPEEATYDVDELARHLIDYVDADEVGLRGDFEDDFYQRQSPPYRAANRALLTLDELALVRGFDARLVDALRPYVTVFPYVDGEGINPNTAPPWVLGTLFHGVAGDYRLASASDAERLVRTRRDGAVICPQDVDHPTCNAPLEEILAGQVFPPAGIHTDVFEVEAQAEVGNVRRTLEAVIDRSRIDDPRVLSWRVR